MTFVTLIVAILSFLPSRVEAGVVIAADFDAVWVPEGSVGPIVAAPFDQQIF